MPQVVEIRNADDPRDVIHRVCQLLAEGQLVALPTEAAYIVVASSLSEVGVQRLQALPATQNSRATGRVALMLKAPEEAHDYVSQMPVAAARLARRAWPGPLTMEFSTTMLGGLYHGLPAITRGLLTGESTALGASPDICRVGTAHHNRSLMVGGAHPTEGMTFADPDRHLGDSPPSSARPSVALRVAVHEVLQHVQRLTPAPLVATADYGAPRPLPRSAADVVARFGVAVSFIIDDGPCRYGEPTTTIRFEGDRWRLLDPGIISPLNIDRLTSEIFLFVCTGNTCRSPMAEALFRHHLARRLKCADDDLMDRGYAVLSAGLSAHSGGSASGESIAVLAEDGIDLRSHESQPVTSRLLQHADQIITMTRGHQQAIMDEHPELSARVRMLSPERSDVSDPYGGGPREYQDCKQEIELHVRRLVEQIPLNH